MRGRKLFGAALALVNVNAFCGEMQQFQINGFLVQVQGDLINLKTLDGTTHQIEAEVFLEALERFAQREKGNVMPCPARSITHERIEGERGIVSDHPKEETELMSIEEIRENISSNNGKVFPKTRESIFTGSALDKAKGNLEIMIKSVKGISTSRKDQENLEELKNLLIKEISDIKKLIYYAPYEQQLSDCPKEKVNSYISFYEEIKKGLEEIQEILNDN